MKAWTVICGCGIALGVACDVGAEASGFFGTIWACFLPFTVGSDDEEEENA